jgi:hypothetical protein
MADPLSPDVNEPTATDDQKPREEAQVLSYELQRDLRRVVELLLIGYKAWLGRQTHSKG